MEKSKRNIVTCEKGHYYDGDKYEKCPHCEETKNNDGIAEPEKGTVHEIYTHEGGSHTLDFWKQKTPDDGVRSDELQSEEEMTPPDPDPVPDTVESDDENEGDRGDASSALKNAVKEASASSVGKTMSYFSMQTEAVSQQKKAKVSADPVVGWLVCIKGCHFGESFPIFAGRNSIGRSPENRIAISDDESISRVKHALIDFEPKKKIFYIHPGDSSGLTYLNNEYIAESHAMNSHDIIELGESRFMLIPLCGESFSWEEYIQAGE